LAEIEEEKGEHPAALARALAAERVNRDVVRASLRYLPEEQALRLLAMSPSALGLALDLACGAGVGSASRCQTYEAVIRSRALALDEAASRTRLLRRDPDPAVAVLESSLVAVSSRLANLMVRSASVGPGAQDAKLLL